MHDDVTASSHGLSPAAALKWLDQEVNYILRVLATHAPDEAPDGAFADEPPTWAVWEDMGMFGDQCGRCGSWCEIVRPGKTQCPTCWDEDLRACGVRAKRLLEKHSAPGGSKGEAR